MRSPAARSSSAWGVPLVAGLCLALCAPPAAANEQFMPLAGSYQAMSLAVGDYWDPGRTRPPPTGRAQLRRAGALIGLGLVRTATAVMHIVFASPERCGPQRRLAWTEKSCRNLKIYGIAGLGLSGAFLLGGGWELAKGLKLRREHEAWKRNHWHHFSMARMQGGLAGDPSHPGPGQL